MKLVKLNGTSLGTPLKDLTTKHLDNIVEIFNQAKNNEKRKLNQKSKARLNMEQANIEKLKAGKS